MTRSFTLAQPYIEDLTYTGYIIEGNKRSANPKDYEVLYHMDTDPDYTKYAAVGDKQEACTISNDADLMRAFYESKLLVSTLDELVRVIKVVHVPDNEHSDDRPGIPFQKVISLKDPKKESFNNAWGAILNRKAIRNMASNLQKLLINSNKELTSFWNDVLFQCSFHGGREQFDKRMFLKILLEHNPGWNKAIPDEHRRYMLLEKCFNLALRWTRFNALWSRIPQTIDEKLAIQDGLFTKEEFFQILTFLEGDMNSNERFKLAREEAQKSKATEDTEAQKRVFGDSLDDIIEVQDDEASCKKQRTERAGKDKGRSIEPSSGHAGPAPGSACYPYSDAQGLPHSSFNSKAWGFSTAGMQGMLCPQTWVVEGSESLPVQAGFPRTEQRIASEAAPAQFPRSRGRPRNDQRPSLPAQQEESASQRIREHHWAGAHYDLGVSLTHDKLLRDSIREAQLEEPYCLPLSWKDQEGNQEEVDVKVVTLALEGLLLRNDLPEVNRRIEGIAKHLAVGFQENTERIAVEMAREYVADEMDRCERHVQQIWQLSQTVIKQKVEEGVRASIKMRRELFARKFYKKKSGEPLPERRITSEEAQAELADKRLRNLIQVELELDLDVDRKISDEQRYLDELIAQRDAEKSKQQKYEEEQTQLMNTIADVVKKGREEAETLRQEIATLKRERDAIERAKTQALEDMQKMHEKLDALEKSKLLKKACDCQVGQVLDELGELKGHSISAFTRARVLEWLGQDVVPLNSAAVQHAAEGTVFDVAAMESVGEPSPPDTAPMDSDVPQSGRSLLEDTQVYNRRVLWHQQEVLEQALEYNADCLHMEHNFVYPLKQWQVIAKDMTAIKDDMLERLRTVKESLKEMDGYLCTNEDVLSGPAKQSVKCSDKISRFSSKHGDKLAELTNEAAAIFDAIAHYVQKFNEKHSEILVQSGVNRAVEDARAKYTALQEVLRAEIDETKARRYADTHDERCECLMLFDRVESIMEDITQQIVRCKDQKDLPDATHLGLRCDQLADCLGSLRLVLRDLQR